MSNSISGTIAQAASAMLNSARHQSPPKIQPTQQNGPIPHQQQNHVSTNKQQAQNGPYQEPRNGPPPGGGHGQGPHPTQNGPIYDQPYEQRRQSVQQQQPQQVKKQQQQNNLPRQIDTEVKYRLLKKFWS